MKSLSYNRRLLQLGLPRLELRRLHLDLVFCYKVVFGLVSVNLNDFFSRFDLFWEQEVIHSSYLNHGVLVIFAALFLLSVS